MGWQQHRENPSPGVHTIQAVAPSKAMPAPATAYQYQHIITYGVSIDLCTSSKSSGYKVASWFCIMKKKYIYIIHTIPGVFHLFASKLASTSLEVFPCFLLENHPFFLGGTDHNGWRLSHYWDLPCLEPLIRNSQTSVLWYHHLRIPSFGSCHKINWWENMSFR